MVSILRTLVGALRGGPEERYVLAERLAHLLSPDAVLSERERYWLSDADFRQRYERFSPRNLRRMDRIFMLDQLSRWATQAPGDTAECGVYEGASSYFICRRLLGSGKVHHLFDSFAGLSAPGTIDGGYWHAGDLSVSEQAARENLSEFDFVRFHKGWIPEKFAEVEEDSFSLVHVDVDLYEPTLASLRFFYPRVVEGGIILLDDHGFKTCPGARRAAEEFFAEHCVTVLDLPTGQGLVLKGT